MNCITVSSLLDSPLRYDPGSTSGHSCDRLAQPFKQGWQRPAKRSYRRLSWSRSWYSFALMSPMTNTLCSVCSCMNVEKKLARCRNSAMHAAKDMACGLPGVSEQYAAALGFRCTVPASVSLAAHRDSELLLTAIAEQNVRYTYATRGECNSSWR